MYADLCARLEKDPRVAPAVDSQQHAFRRLLLNECQAAFERLLEPQAEGGPQDDEELLGRWQSCGDALESLAALLTVAGPTFDVESWALKQQVDAIFARVGELVATPALPARTRFLLRDVLDLRSAGWPSQAGAATKRPEPMTLCQDHMTLGQVRGSAGCTTVPPAAAAAAAARADAEPCPDRGSLRAAAAEFTPLARCGNLRSAAAEFTPAAQRGSLRAAAAEFIPAAKAPSPATPTTATPTSSAPASPKVAPRSGGPSELELASRPFSVRDFHRELSAVMKDLGVDRNVGVAVRRIRAQNVPKTHQAREFADVLTRAAEESRGPVRRSAFAFAAGLAASASDSAFGREECMAGVEAFFGE
ncbi:unnamed protein product, partial [Prorocentrum cordatum]